MATEAPDGCGLYSSAASSYKHECMGSPRIWADHETKPGQAFPGKEFWGKGMLATLGVALSGPLPLPRREQELHAL